MDHNFSKGLVFCVAMALAGIAPHAIAQSTEIPRPILRFVRTVLYQADGRDAFRDCNVATYLTITSAPRRPRRRSAFRSSPTIELNCCRLSLANFCPNQRPVFSKD